VKLEIINIPLKFVAAFRKFPKEKIFATNMKENLVDFFNASEAVASQAATQLRASAIADS
jgi:hypothetical protein